MRLRREAAPLRLRRGSMTSRYGSRMGHLQPLVTRWYADFGMQCSAICRSSSVAHR
jgi:hypothetical protein